MPPSSASSSSRHHNGQTESPSCSIATTKKSPFLSLLPGGDLGEISSVSLFLTQSFSYCFTVCPLFLGWGGRVRRREAVSLSRLVTGEGDESTGSSTVQF